MKNCTISTRFFADVLQLDSQSQLLVLTTCHQLIDSDEDAIEQFELSDGAPGVLADFVKRLKRRVRCARRRRQHATARPQKATVSNDSPATSAPTQSVSDAVGRPRDVHHAVMMLKVASDYVLELGDTFDYRQIKYVYKLVSNVLMTFRTNLYVLRRKADRIASIYQVGKEMPSLCAG